MNTPAFLLQACVASCPTDFGKPWDDAQKSGADETAIKQRMFPYCRPQVTYIHNYSIRRPC